MAIKAQLPKLRIRNSRQEKRQAICSVTYKDVNSSKKNGILSRWTEYADSGHGNNKKLVELLKKEGISYAEKNFQWSILETLSLNVTQKVATDREKLYKEKLGTREHGYNEN